MADELGRAESLLAIGRHDDARTILNRVIAAEPDSYQAHCLMSRAELGAGKHSSALLHAEAAIAIQPNADWAHRLRAIALREQYAYPQAAEAARTALRLRPEAWENHVSLVNCLIGDPGRSPADLREAYRGARRACELAPHQPVAHQVMARVYEALGDRRAAMHADETALGLDPMNVEARNNIAVAQLRSGRLTRAGRGLVEVLASEPHNGLVQANLRVAAVTWIWRRTEHAALGWIGVVLLGAIWPRTDAIRVVSAAVAVAVTAVAVVGYLRLPRPLRRLVRSLPGREQPWLIFAVAAAVVCWLGLVLRSGNAEAGAAVTPFVLLMAIPATARMRGRFFAAIARAADRWRYRWSVVRGQDSDRRAPR